MELTCYANQPRKEKQGQNYDHTTFISILHNLSRYALFFFKLHSKSNYKHLHLLPMSCNLPEKNEKRTRKKQTGDGTQWNHQRTSTSQGKRKHSPPAMCF